MKQVFAAQHLFEVEMRKEWLEKYRKGTRKGTGYLSRGFEGRPRLLKVDLEQESGPAQPSPIAILPIGCFAAPSLLPTHEFPH
jgi:hypothetical protein